MVKKTTEYKEKKKESNNYGIFIGVIVAIVIIIIGVTSFSNNNQALGDYRGFSFDQSGEFWQTRIMLNEQVYNVPFYNHPLEVIDLPFEDNVVFTFLDNPLEEIYIAVEPEANSVPVLAGVNIGRVTGKLYGVPTSSALYTLPENQVNESEYPQVSCEDAVGKTVIFYIDNEADRTGVFRNKEYANCIHVDGVDDDGVLAAADLLAYKLLEIIPVE